MDLEKRRSERVGRGVGKKLQRRIKEKKASLKLRQLRDEKLRKRRE